MQLSHEYSKRQIVRRCLRNRIACAMVTETFHRHRVFIFRLSIMMKYIRYWIFVFCNIACALAAAELPYELELDIEFVQKLGELELNDYADMHIKQMAANYPKFQELIGLERARFFYATGSAKQADAAIAAIRKDSPFYPQALILKGQVHAVRRNFAEAEKTFNEYFALVPAAPKRRSDKEDFKRAIRIFNRVLTELGKGKEAAAILDKLPKDNSQGAQQTTERQVAYLKIQAIVDIQDNLLKGGKPVDVKALNGCIDQLKSLQFGRDGVSASASLLTARIYNIIGFHELNTLKPEAKANIKSFLNAIKTIKMVDSFLEEIEKARGKDDSLMPEAMFLKGLAIRGNAEVMHFANKDDLAAKQLKGAATYFETLLASYPNSSRQSDALVEHQACAALSDKYQLGVKIALSNLGDGSAEIDARLEQAQSLFAAKKYAEAAAIYMEALRLGRRSRKLPSLAVRLLICLGQLDRIAEGDAILSYLVDAFPDDKDTADAAFRFGGLLYERVKKENNPEIKAMQEDSYLRAWEQFVTIAPGHPKAPEVAYAVAQRLFNIAAELAKKANAEKNATRKNELKARTAEAYRAAIPSFRRLAEDFAAFDKGVLAWYKLGWIYYFIDDKPQAADAFLKYVELEESTDTDRLAYKLEAKFRAAEQLLFGENPEEALPLFQDIDRDTAEDGPLNLHDAKTASVREQAAAFLPMTYDFSAEKLRPQLDEAAVERRKIQAKAKIFIDQATVCNAQGDALGKELEELQRANADLKESVGRLDLDFDKRAENQAKQQAQGGQTDYADAYAKLRPAIEKAANDEIYGILQDTQEATSQNRTVLETLKAQSADFDSEIARRQQEIADMQEKVDTLKQRIMNRMDAFQKIEKSIVDAEAEKERLDTLAADAQTALDNAPNEERNQTMEKLRQAQENVRKSSEQLTQIYDERAKVVTQEAQKELESWKKLYDEQSEELEDSRRALVRLQNDHAVVKARIQAAAAMDKAFASRLSFAKSVQKALALPVTERLAANKDLNGRAAAYLKLEDAAFNLQMARIELQKKHLDEYRQEAEKVLLEFKKLEDVLEERIKPVKEEFNAKKQSAVAAYTDFLKKYPDSRNAPVNMARLAGAQLELEMPAEAVATLTKLMETFPEYDDRKPNCNPAKACQALYSLARAQTEANLPQAAAASFKRLVENPKFKQEVDSFSLSKLRYLAEKGLEINAPGITFHAGQQILAQIAAGKPEALQLTKAAVENTSVITAEAAVKMKKPQEAIDILEKLLADNPKTARFFDAKFLIADAKFGLNPPDADGAEKALNEIANFTKDAAVANRALCKAAQILAQSDQPEKRKQALSRFHTVVDFADQTNPDNLPWIEQSIAGAIKLHRELDIDTDLILKLTTTYKKLFPQGKLLP
ncbi:MAG: tetratricopeptide repeat protein [Lentisphaeria bacterium]|nr:tetratricopeptide repeat protein [Lentisphaeria bacterium]